MKKENISILLVVLMFVVVGFALSMGWLTIENQNTSFSNLKSQQYVFVKEISSLRNFMMKMNQQTKDMAYNLRNLKLAINTGKITERELSARINSMNDELTKWQVISDQVITKIENMDTKIKLSEKTVKNINLGKVSVEKDIAQNTQEKRPE